MTALKGNEAQEGTFFKQEELDLMGCFLEKGYITFDIEEKALLKELSQNMVHWANSQLSQGDALVGDSQKELNTIHNRVQVNDLNSFRLSIIEQLNQHKAIHTKLFRLAESHIHSLVGNELAMQRSINLSIQLPGDDSSLLPIHSDVWSGNSPYEVVFWLPLVDCHRTKSMFLLPKAKTDLVLGDFSKYSNLSSEAFFEEIQHDIEWVELKFGQAMIFWHGLIHGNRVNLETETRWSLNTRFKSLLTPYHQKEIGEYFQPISIRPVTRMGYAYQKPRC